MFYRKRLRLESFDEQDPNKKTQWGTSSAFTSSDEWSLQTPTGMDMFLGSLEPQQWISPSTMNWNEWDAIMTDDYLLPGQ